MEAGKTTRGRPDRNGHGTSDRPDRPEAGLERLSAGLAALAAGLVQRGKEPGSSGDSIGSVLEGRKAAAPTVDAPKALPEQALYHPLLAFLDAKGGASGRDAIRVAIPVGAGRPGRQTREGGPHE